MRKLVAASLLSCASLASAAVVGFEFNFTPYVGNPAKADHVQTVPGIAAVFVNNVPIANQDVGQQDVPVLFENKEISPAVWVPASSMGPSLRKGKNKIRIEFAPSNAKTPYDAQLRWAAVSDQETSTAKGGAVTSTNQSNEGADTRKAVVGKLVLEREFTADFATDAPWHHLPAVTSLGDADKQALAALIGQRAELFKPDFSAAYQFLKTANTPGMQLDLAGIKKAKILDKAYAAGLRMAAPAAASLDYVLTGNPEVVVRSTTGNLFPLDPKALAKIKGDELQMGLSMVLPVLFPAQITAVRDGAGKWSVAY